MTEIAKDNLAKTEELAANLKAWREAVGAQLPTVNPKYEPKKN